jgi:hypothetical protein
LVAVVLLFVISPFDVRPKRMEITNTQMEDADESRSAVTLTFPDDVIGLPIDIGDPDVTVVWIYPVLKSHRETN